MKQKLIKKYTYWMFQGWYTFPMWGVFTSQSTRKLNSEYDSGKKPDGYKPTGVPNALKVINGQMKNSLEVVEMTDSKEEAAVDIVKEINCIYIPTTDTEKTAQWYMDHLGLKLMSRP